MHYGHLSADQTEYIIERPDTPTPWINYISNLEGYCGIVSQSGGGFSFFKDPPVPWLLVPYRGQTDRASTNPRGWGADRGRCYPAP